MNSAYGFCGASKGFLPCVPIAASVTATGRRMIEQTRHLAQTLVPGSKVVYGGELLCLGVDYRCRWLTLCPQIPTP